MQTFINVNAKAQIEASHRAFSEAMISAPPMSFAKVTESDHMAAGRPGLFSKWADKQNDAKRRAAWRRTWSEFDRLMDWYCPVTEWRLKTEE